MPRVTVGAAGGALLIGAALGVFLMVVAAAAAVRATTAPTLVAAATGVAVPARLGAAAPAFKSGARTRGPRQQNGKRQSMKGRMHADSDCQTSSDVAVTASQRSSSPTHDGRRPSVSPLLEPTFDVHDRVDAARGVVQVDVTPIGA